MRAAIPNSPPVWTIDDGWGANLSIVHPAPPPRRTKPRPRLTPEQRGRFWQSVVDTGAAAKAEPGGKGQP
mgnify:CR=1 FL=1